VSDRERLLKHLQNLQKSGKTDATLNIAWLLSVLQEPVATTEAPPKPEMPPNEIILDGGTF